MSELQDYLIAVRWAQEQINKPEPGKTYPSKESVEERKARFYAIEKVYDEKVLSFIKEAISEKEGSKVTTKFKK